MPALKFQVEETLYDPKSLLDEQNFYNQKQGSPAELTKKLTYMLGKMTNSFPITSMTMGGTGFGDKMKKASVAIKDTQFTYPVVGGLDKGGEIGTNINASGTPGLGGQPFKIRLTDNWIKRFYTIQSPRGVQLYVLEDGQPYGTEFEYTVQLDPAGPTDFCPLSELTTGTVWAEVSTSVPESESRSTESKMAMPGMFKNQMGYIRAGLSWAGNAANKVMKFEVTTEAVGGVPGRSTSVWMDWALYQFELRWLNDNEHYAWYSKYNRKPNGDIGLKDLMTGKVIPRGSGLLEQIRNKSTYSRLTYESLQQKIGDALYGIRDAAGMTITLYTGKGGLREIDRVMKEKSISFMTSFGDVAEKFISGSNYELMLGGYFNGFYHIDGYVVKVKYADIFDHGRVAQAQRESGYIHPETGFPLESYRMVFIDDSDVDGSPNIQHVVEEGREFIDGVVAGLTPMPKSLKILSANSGFQGSKFLSTEVDKSHYTRLSSCGYQIMRNNRCFDLQCTAGF